jgi:hypothetical protein
MAQDPGDRLQALMERLRRNPALPEELPVQEGAFVRAALARQSVHAIAQQHQVSEGAVWRALADAARLAAGEAPARRVETGGLGSDTDPGVTGGYGDTGFGSLGNEPPEPIPEEPTGRTGGGGD